MPPFTEKRALLSRASTVAVVGLLLVCGCGFGGGKPAAKGREKPGVAQNRPEPFPLHWHLGKIDPRFNLSADQVKEAFQEAAAVWEAQAGKKLFQFQESDGFPVQLLFDHRQEMLNDERDASRQLKTEEVALETLKHDHEAAKARLDTAKQQLQSEDTSFSQRLNDHNRRVEYWNAQGGAPPDQATALDGERRELEAENIRIQQDDRQVKTLVAQANTLVESYNLSSSRFNESVATYNGKFAGVHKQILGECIRTETEVREVKIYAFNDEAHLAIVLAHELGHALGLGHVPGDGALMSEVEKGSKFPTKLVLTDRDKAALKQLLSPT